MITQYECDRCRESIDTTGLSLELDDIQTDPKVDTQSYEALHLCEGCAFAFRGFMDQFGGGA